MPEESAVNSDALMSMLGEIGSIAMGAASISLSELTGRKIQFTSPKVWLGDKPVVENPGDMKILISVNYKGDITGSSLMTLREGMAIKIANLMLAPMGMEVSELDDLASSALMEAMNQMMGAAARALSELTGAFIDITTPTFLLLENGLTEDMLEDIKKNMKGKVASVQFTVWIDGEEQEGHMYIFYPLSLAAKLVINTLKNMNSMKKKK
ncbi:hypothetical protein GM182_06890 [bacterium 3DAC]|jgi:flagellar motor switch protein FliN/FliY|nr:hypothetical protein [Dictyoglomota bacterium]UZN23571.1 hypothetical protein GM182_06890 [bacterium 3DAC]